MVVGVKADDLERLSLARLPAAAHCFNHGKDRVIDVACVAQVEEQRAMPLDRLTQRDDGCVEYAFRKPWRDGTRAVVLTADDLLARLCAPWEKARRRVFT